MSTIVDDYETLESPLFSGEGIHSTASPLIGESALSATLGRQEALYTGEGLGQISAKLGRTQGERVTLHRESYYREPTSLSGREPLIDRHTMQEQTGIAGDLTAILDTQPAFALQRAPRVALLDVSATKADAEGRVLLRPDDQHGPWVSEGTTHVAVLIDAEGKMFGQAHGIKPGESLTIDPEMLKAMAGETHAATMTDLKDTTLKINVDHEGEVTLPDVTKMSMFRPEALLGSKKEGRSAAHRSINGFMGYGLRYDTPRNSGARKPHFEVPRASQRRSRPTESRRHQPRVDDFATEGIFDDLFTRWEQEQSTPTEDSFRTPPRTEQTSYTRTQERPQEAPKKDETETPVAPYVETERLDGGTGEEVIFLAPEVRGGTGNYQQPEVREIEVTPQMLVRDVKKKPDEK